jgi:hypothetical protein
MLPLMMMVSLNFLKRKNLNSLRSKKKVSLILTRGLPYNPIFRDLDKIC